MALSFVETMRGELSTPAGARSWVDFHVRAAGGAGGRFGLEGVVHAPPWAPETTGEGTLHLSLVPARIAYDVRFTAADGRALRLHGEKRPRMLRLVHSMTVLPITLSDDTGAALAQGTLRFDLLELPAFVASWLSPKARPHRQLQVRHVAVARSRLGGAR